MKIKAATLLFSIIMVSLVTFASNNPVELKSQTASISGTVHDMQSGEALAGVKISIEGTELNVFSDLDGNFTIKDITPGSYNLVLSLISYNNSLIENIAVKASKEEKIEIKLSNE